MVPKTASPTFCESSHRHWRTNRSASGAEVRAERGDHGGEHAADALGVVHAASFGISLIAAVTAGPPPTQAPNTTRVPVEGITSLVGICRWMAKIVLGPVQCSGMM